MGKFNEILICTDLDGTLLREDKTISKENREAIEYFKAEGGYFTFITGRMPYISGELCKEVGCNAPFGCFNGGGVYDHMAEKYVYLKTLPKCVVDIAETVEKNLPQVGFQFDLADRIYFCRENDTMAIFREITGVPNNVKDYHLIDEPVAKVIFGTQDEAVMDKLIKLIAEHPASAEVNCIRSEFSLYDIVPQNVGKGTALEKLAEHLSIDMKKTIAVGDYNNDISMIKAAGVGVAVANAVESLKDVADYITVSNEEHAIAKIISDIEEGRLKI